ncbi:hypothetical protein COOONC_15285 [Cooperia oncophora]
MQPEQRLTILEGNWAMLKDIRELVVGNRDDEMAKVLETLFKERKGVSGRFYSLLIVQALLAKCFGIVIRLATAIQLANLTNKDSWWSGIYNTTPLLITSIVHSFTYHFAFVQTYMSFFVSLYRMTVIAFPTFHVKIWNYCFPGSVAVTLLTPFISVHPMLYHSSWFYINKETQCFDIRSNAA